MFKSPKDYIIAGLVLILILVILFRKTQPVDQTDNQSFKNTIEKLTLEKAQKDAQISTIFQESEHKDSTVKVELRAKDKEINLLKAKLSKQRPPITIMADSVPELKAFIATQDSLIAATEQRADTLQKAYTSQIETTRDLKRLIVDKDKIQQEMFSTCSERVDKLQRDYEKEHKRKTGWKKAFGVTLVVALVEGALIALQ
jgi:hypothetical protein